MRRPFPRVLLPLLLSVALASIQSALGQAVDYPETCAANVENLTVHAAPDADLSLPGGQTVAAGDTIAVYTQRGTCVGYGVWHKDDGVTLAAAGVRTDTTSAAGYREGEPLQFEVYDVSANRRVFVAPTNAEYVPCENTGVPFCGDGTYQRGAFVQLSGFSPGETTQHRIATSDGWNFLSVPVHSHDRSFGSVLPSCTKGFTFRATSGYQAIQPSRAVFPALGLFARCEGDTVQVRGTRAQPKVNVQKGWNAIGSFTKTVSADSISTSPEGLLQGRVYRMTPNGGYEAASVLHPGNGYWVRSEGPGTLQLGGASASAQGKLASRSPAQSKRQPRSDAPGERARLLIRDARGRETELALLPMMTDTERRLYSLPPAPPSAVFDVRFSGDASAAAYSGAAAAEKPSRARHRVEVQGASFPLTVRLTSRDFDHAIRIAPNGENIAISRDQPVAKLTRPTSEFELETTPQPEGFHLAKIRPNPIQNQARIHYVLPERTAVSIVLFDVLGRQVARIVDGRQQAGVYNAAIPVETLSSGTYFARMRAGSFQQTRRLTIVR